VLAIEEEHEYIEDPLNYFARGEKGKPWKAKVKITVSYNRSNLNNLKLEIKTPENVVAEKKILSLENLSFGSGTPYSEMMSFYVRNDLSPDSLKVELSGSYTTSANEIRSVQDFYYLPMALFCIVIEP